MQTILKNNWKLFLIGSLTFGLAPFNPPHILGKIQWIFGGNAFTGESAMQTQDYIDLLLHGVPWLLLLSSATLLVLSRKKNNGVFHKK